MATYNVSHLIARYEAAGGTFADLQLAVDRTYMLDSSGMVRSRAGESAVEQIVRAAEARAQQTVRAASPQVARAFEPVASDAQINYILTLLRRMDDSDYCAVSHLISVDGTIDLAAIRSMTRGEASQAITTLTSA